MLERQYQKLQIAYQASSAMLDKVKQENATLAQQNQILTARIEAKDKTVVKIPNKIKPAILKDENTKALSNSPQAFSFYLQSAKQGFVEAQYNVALMFSKGEGVGKNNDQSLFWYKKAASQGHKPSQEIINRLNQPPS